ncbi:MAG: hypothetical protein H0U32_03290, partial [Thermoleophilaceae bacterium]|nr:hypothetical protein [Thermoleophilaceae bacterium]
MRPLAITAFAGVALAALAAPAAAQEPRQAAAGKAKPSLVRVEILTRSQSAVARKGLVRARIAFKGRGVVRVGGRVRAGSRSLKLFRAKALQPRRRGTRIVGLKLTRKGIAALRKARAGCASSTVLVNGTFRSGHRLASRKARRRTGKRLSRLGRKRRFT